jgi:alpha-tubulin suppressor-like RCC1 family protein
MSRRYLAGFIPAGLFNPLAAPTPSYTLELWAWGSNAYYELGLGNLTYRSSPNQVGALTSWNKIATGQWHTLATKTDGTLWSWGRNIYGQLGLNTSYTTNCSSPKQVGALTTWLNIACGYGHTVATKTDGTIWTWGSNAYGELGLGTTGGVNYKSSPNQVGTLTTWSKISTGHYHTLATKTDGTLWSWGYNGSGQLGLNTSYTTNRSSPNQVGALTTWSKISTGRYYNVAIKTDGTLWSWGQNNTGQLGLGNTTDYSSPKQVGALTTWLNIACGYFHTLATKTDGTLWSWGANGQGQLGQSNITYRSSPVQVGALTTWSNITAGSESHFSMATKTDGTLWSWGKNNRGQLGLGNTTNYSSPKQVGSLTTWLNIAGGNAFSIALKY